MVLNRPTGTGWGRPGNLTPERTVSNVQREARVFAELLHVGELALKALAEDAAETLRELLRAVQREMTALDVVAEAFDVEERAFAPFQDLFHDAGGVGACRRSVASSRPR